MRNISILQRNLYGDSDAASREDPGLEHRPKERLVSGGDNYDDDDDRMMMPSARWSRSKSNLPTTLMAVRAQPRFKLRSKSIMDQAPFYKRETSHRSKILPEMDWAFDCSHLFSLVLEG